MKTVYPKIIGTGSALPDFVLTNEMLSKLVETNDEWISSRTGIRERRIELNDKNFELGARAAQAALDAAGVSADEIDFTILSTSTPDFITPSLACAVQSILGIKTSFAFDVSAGCTGFVYALDIGSMYIKNGRAKKGLIIASDTMTRFTDYTDRSTCILFGDGAGAAVLSGEEELGVLSTYIATDCKKENIDNLYIHNAMSAAQYNKEDKSFGTLPSSLRPEYIYMNGRAVYEFVVGIIPETLEKCAEVLDGGISDIDWFIFHQANKRIIDYVVKKYGIDPEKAPINIDKYGNTSSATIPILLDECVKSGKIKKGDVVALIGFGSGFTYGASIIRW